jgi:riboflavin synthase
MFTGLIEEVGVLGTMRAAATGTRLGIRCPSLARVLRVGESVAVNGACLTVVSRGGDDFDVEAVGDTLEKTTLRRAKPGARVNLERALSAAGRLDGHLVMGHVTGTARIRSWAPAASAASAAQAESPRGDLEAWFLVVDLDPSWADRVAAEGSIAIDGVSLTVAGLDGADDSSGSGRLEARISVIPHTRLATNLADRKAGDEVNVELDVIASYVRAAVAAFFKGGATGGTPAPDASRLDIERLKSWGYR